MGDQLPARPGHLDVEPGPATRGHLDVEPTGPRKSGYVADTRRWVVLALFGANTFLWAGSWCVCAAPLIPPERTRPPACAPPGLAVNYERV
jgi:hypothetical protein